MERIRYQVNNFLKFACIYGSEVKLDYNYINRRLGIYAKSKPPYENFFNLSLPLLRTEDFPLRPRHKVDR